MWSYMLHWNQENMQPYLVARSIIHTHRPKLLSRLIAAECGGGARCSAFERTYVQRLALQGIRLILQQLVPHLNTNDSLKSTWYGRNILAHAASAEGRIGHHLQAQCQTRTELRFHPHQAHVRLPENSELRRCMHCVPRRTPHRCPSCTGSYPPPRCAR